MKTWLDRWRRACELDDRRMEDGARAREAEADLGDDGQARVDRRLRRELAELSIAVSPRLAANVANAVRRMPRESPVAVDWVRRTSLTAAAAAIAIFSVWAWLAPSEPPHAAPTATASSTAAVDRAPGRKLLLASVLRAPLGALDGGVDERLTSEIRSLAHDFHALARRTAARLPPSIDAWVSEKTSERP